MLTAGDKRKRDTSNTVNNVEKEAKRKTFPIATPKGKANTAVNSTGDNGSEEDGPDTGTDNSRLSLVPPTFSTAASPLPVPNAVVHTTPTTEAVPLPLVLTSKIDTDTKDSIAAATAAAAAAAILKKSRLRNGAAAAAAEEAKKVGGYKCLECKKLFSTRGNLHRHESTHTGIRPHR